MGIQAYEDRLHHSVGPADPLHPGADAVLRLAADDEVGGMGEVYRATDENLCREVAIKGLPQDLAKDEVRLARFKREALLR